ncbi:MAG TPA: hypothetical protein VEP66_22665 [Myxococcales bacterium]|nr:hypothetical protein [Myxococcales bacterium]
MSGERQDLDPAARVAADLRARLRSMEGDELIELCAQLLSTYVVEGVLPLSKAGESTDLAPDAAGEESFAQLLKRLKAAKKDPVLEKFFIDGENISVRIEGQGVLPITEYRRPIGPPPSGPGVTVQVVQRRESAPGAAGSIYNRALYQPEAAPPARSSVPPTPQQRPAPQPAQPTPTSQPPTAPNQKKPPEEQPRNDRFSLIELE